MEIPLTNKRGIITFILLKMAIKFEAVGMSILFQAGPVSEFQKYAMMI